MIDDFTLYLTFPIIINTHIVCLSMVCDLRLWWFVIVAVPMYIHNLSFYYKILLLSSVMGWPVVCDCDGFQVIFTSPVLSLSNTLAACI